MLCLCAMCVSLCLSPSQRCAAHPVAPAPRSAAGSAAEWAGRGSWQEGPARKGPDGVWIRFEGDTKLSGETSFKPQPERLSSSKPSPEEPRCQTSGPLNPSAPCPGLDVRAPQAASPGPPAAGAALSSDGRLRAALRAGDAGGRGLGARRGWPPARGESARGLRRFAGGRAPLPRPRRGVSVRVEGRVKRSERRSLRRCQRRRRGPFGPRAASPLPPPRSPLSRRGGGWGAPRHAPASPAAASAAASPGGELGAGSGRAWGRGEERGGSAGRHCGGCGCQGARPRLSRARSSRERRMLRAGKAPAARLSYGTGEPKAGRRLLPPALQPPARSALHPEGRAGREAQVGRCF